MTELLQRILNNAGRMEALRQTSLLDTPVEEAFDRLTRLASKFVGAPVSLVSLVEPHRQFLKSAVGLPEAVSINRETPISHSFCKHVVATGEPLVIEDARHHPLVAENPAVKDWNIISYLGIPLKTSDGWTLGSFCVIDHQARTWSAEEIETMTMLAESVMTEIQLRMEIKARDDTNLLLQDRNAELDAFAHTVSHNLKNPIGSIMGWAGLIRSYNGRMSQDELLEMAEKIEESAQIAGEIINALLMLAGVSRAPLTIEDVEIQPVIERVLTRLETEIVASRAEIHILPDMPACRGYAPWLEEVYANYISNAIKYGGDPPRIEIGAEMLDDGCVRYWVSDNGIGISPEAQQELFVPFTRLPESQFVEGHGLGLSIVRRIIERLGGTVGVESETGQGSRFTFTLPCTGES